MGNKAVRFLFVAGILCLLLASCASPKTEVASEPAVVEWLQGSDSSAFVKQFNDMGIPVQVKDGKVALRTDVELPEGNSIVLDTGERWILNLNGHTIRQMKSKGSAMIVVENGSLAILNGNPDIYKGGLASLDGRCVHVKTNSELIVQAGTIQGYDYAFEVDKGAILKVSDGHISGEKLPILAHEGWIGSLTGGLFSHYDESYADGIKGQFYAAIVTKYDDMVFYKAWPDAFRVAKEGAYSGKAMLRFSAPGGKAVYFKLYRTRDVLDYNAKNAFSAYEWLMYPGQIHDVDFVAGDYILKVAEGEQWDENKASFGDDGEYWYMDPFTFENTKVYAIDIRDGSLRYHPDSLENFQSGRLD